MTFGRFAHCSPLLILHSFTSLHGSQASITANEVEGLVNLLCKMTSGDNYLQVHFFFCDFRIVSILLVLNFAIFMSSIMYAKPY